MTRPLNYPRCQTVPRRWLCLDCAKPNSAIREGVRCTECSVINQIERARSRSAAARYVKARVIRTIQPVVFQRHSDSDITLYRNERARRATREAAYMESIRLLFEAEVELTRPKRGRPKTDYGKRNRAA